MGKSTALICACLVCLLRVQKPTLFHSKLRGPRNVNGNVSRGTLTASRERRKNLIVRRTLPHSAKHRELVPTVVLAECLILEEV